VNVYESNWAKRARVYGEKGVAAIRKFGRRKQYDFRGVVGGILIENALPSGGEIKYDLWFFPVAAHPLDPGAEQRSSCF
jgi:hypothetical protein